MVTIQGYYERRNVIETKLEINNFFNKSLFAVFNKPTFVFISQEHYDYLNPKLDEDCSFIGGADDTRTVDDLLKEPILYAISTGDLQADIIAVVSTIEAYTKQSMNYLVITKIEEE